MKYYLIILGNFAWDDFNNNLIKIGIVEKLIGYYNNFVNN